jgi:phosphatidylserine synthase
MVSTFKYAHLGHKLFGVKKDFAYLPLLLVVVILAVIFFQIALPLLAIIYIASGIIGIGLEKYLDFLDRRQDRETFLKNSE